MVGLDLSFQKCQNFLNRTIIKGVTGIFVKQYAKFKSAKYSLDWDILATCEIL